LLVNGYLIGDIVRWDACVRAESREWEIIAFRRGNPVIREFVDGSLSGEAYTSVMGRIRRIEGYR
jgi:hypothetical protein